MLVAKAERTDLLQLGVRQWQTEHTDHVPAPTKEGCVLVWHQQNAILPDALVVTDGSKENFLAWTATYLPHLAPITALVSVDEHRAWKDNGDDRARKPVEHDKSFDRGWFGVLHAEVVAACSGTFAPLYVGLTPFVSTFSWLAIQLITSSSEATASFFAAREAWDEARHLLDARRLGYASEDVEAVWALICDPSVGGSEKQNRPAREVRAFLDSVRDGEPKTELLPAAKDHAEALVAMTDGPIEGRVETFRKLLRTLYERRDPPATHAVLAGFALSQISQGSFAHVALLGPRRVSDVRPLLWYGWFDFSRHTPEAGAPGGSAASLQLLQLLKSNCASKSICHVALDELRVLSRQKQPYADSLLDLRHPIAVEVVSGAVSFIQPGPFRGSDNRSRHSQRSLFDDE
jgi:hypothetical protein